MTPTSSNNHPELRAAPSGEYVHGASLEVQFRTDFLRNIRISGEYVGRDGEWLILTGARMYQGADAVGRAFEGLLRVREGSRNIDISEGRLSGELSLRSSDKGAGAQTFALCGRNICMFLVNEPNGSIAFVEGVVASVADNAICLNAATSTSPIAHDLGERDPRFQFRSFRDGAHFGLRHGNVILIQVLPEPPRE